MNVIFIDDDEDLNFLQEKMCARSNKIANYYISTSAINTLSYLSDIPDPPDIIFVDIHMPKMNGFEFIVAYENKFYSKFPDTQLFMVSSSVREQDRKTAMGFKSVRGFLEKPLTEEKLEEILYQYAKT